MTGFKDFLAEQQVEPDNSELIAGIEAAFKKYFPNGMIKAQTKKTIGSWGVSVNAAMIGQQSDQQSNIWRNDPIYMMFTIEGNPDAYVAERLLGNVSVKPEAGSHYAMDTIKVPFRKSRGDVKKMIKTFDTHFSRVKAVVKENEANIYGRERIADKYFQ